MSNSENLVEMEFLLFECLQDLTGGDLVFLLGVNSLLVDITTTEERTTRLFWEEENKQLKQINKYVAPGLTFSPLSHQSLLSVLVDFFLVGESE